uniref:Uncharacterized protein n=1 Tax=Arundo donax TaxID=35708 RepID=A0A0A9AXT4_ARUDO
MTKKSRTNGSPCMEIGMAS